MNKINPKKLLNSKWTALNPTHKEKHFIVTEIEFNDNDMIVSCCLEAVMTKRVIPINWHKLKDHGDWLQGWK